MRTVQRSVFMAGMIVLVAAAIVVSGCTVDQILIGQWYTIYTPPTGACPRLTWRFVVNPQRSLSGILATDAQRPIAELSGVVNADDTFRITATGLAASRTAQVTGQFTSMVSTISIHGDVAGTACDGQTFKMRLGGYFSFQGGGGGGGG